MNEGKIEQVGSPREVYDTPANDFVMGFLGPVSTARRPPRAPARRDGLAARREPGAIEAMVCAVVHLGFEVRVELELPGRRARPRPAHARSDRASSS